MLGMMFIIILIPDYQSASDVSPGLCPLGSEMTGFSMVLMNIGTALNNYSFIFLNRFW